MSAISNDLRGGALAINKPAGITSHDVVAKIRKLYGTKKVGHTGTLDPMATGVLVVLVGRAVKASDALMSGRKKYRAVLCLGMRSDTEDITGNITYSDAPVPGKETVLGAINSFVGDIMQVPPMYSALKSGGRKLVDLARQGIVVERQDILDSSRRRRSRIYARHRMFKRHVYPHAVRRYRRKTRLRRRHGRARTPRSVRL